MTLTIGMSAYDDYSSVAFTLQGLLIYHDLADTEILVVDQRHDADLRDYMATLPKQFRYIEGIKHGNTHGKQQVFTEARGEFVLCVDSHVLLYPSVLPRLREYVFNSPNDYLHGVLYFNDPKHKATHLDPQWGSTSYGVWGYDKRVRQGEPFEIPAHGNALFCCKRTAFPGFHPHFKGFAPEEFYIHEKARRAGMRVLCLPWLGYWHRFRMAIPPLYELDNLKKLKNYYLAWDELGWDTSKLSEEFRGTNAIDYRNRE